MFHYCIFSDFFKSKFTGTMELLKFINFLFYKGHLTDDC